MRDVIVAALLAAPALPVGAQASTTPRPLVAPLRHTVRWYTTADGLPGNFVSAMQQAQDGTLWLVAGGVLAQFDGRTFREEWWRPRGTTGADGEYAFEIATAGDTVRVITSANRTVARVGGVWREVPASVARPRVPTRNTGAPRWLTRDGRLIVATAEALEIYPANGGPAERIAGNFIAGASSVATITEDHEGGVWVGTGARGVLSLRPVRLQQYATSPDPDRALVHSIGMRRDRTALVVTNRVSELRDGRLATIDDGVVPDNVLLGAAAEDRHGTLWVSYVTRDERAMLASRTRRGDVVRVPVGEQVVHIVDDTSHAELLVLSASSLCAVSSGTAAVPPTRCTALDAWGARTVVLAPDGTRWVAGQRGVVAVARDPAAPLRYFTAARGFPLQGARALHWDHDGALWVGLYGGGLARLHRDSLRVLTRDDGLAENVVSSILEDDHGTFWMGGNRGVHTLTRAQRDAWVRGSRTRVAGELHDERAGLRNPEGSGWHALRDANGSLWFPTFGGAVVVPREVTSKLTPVFGAVAISRVVALDSTYDATRPVRLPRGVRQLTVEPASVSLQSPTSIPMEYRLGGEGDGWYSVSADRVIRLNALRGGRWTLEVRNVADSAVHPNATARVEIVVPHVLHETWWVRTLVLLALLGAGAAGVQLRTRTLHARARALRDEVEEQTHWLIVEQDRTAAALERAIETEGQLRELLTSRARSFASLSHELRTPMTLISEPLREVVQEEAHRLPSSVRDRMHTVMAAVGRLERLTGQFFDVADTHSGTLRLRRRTLDFSGFLRETVLHLLPLASRKSVELTVHVPADMPVTARIDPDQMDKVVTNLVTNAVRHVPDGGTVEVVLWREQGEEPHLVFEVRDNGPGIAPEVAERVFDPFFQGPGATGGMGLGLALSRDIVVQHGGTIEVYSDVGLGATFRVTLPRRVDAAVDAEGVAAVGRPAGGMSAAGVSAAPRDELPAVTSHAPLTSTERTAGLDLLGELSCSVLVVEDDYDLREFLQQRLSVRHTVRTAEHGEAALAVLQGWAPDVVVSDIMMPGLDGLALCRILKADPATRTIPVVLLTAKGTLDDQERGLMVGADAYIVKPFDVKQLALHIENLVRLRRSIAERFEQQVPVWATLLLRTGRRQLDVESEQLLAKLYQLLSDRMGDPAVDIDAMARALMMSRSTLYRRVRELLNCSPNDLLTEVRLEQGAMLLRITREPVGVIAQRVGFASASYFSRRFTAHFGMSPAGYRRGMAGN